MGHLMVVKTVVALWQRRVLQRDLKEDNEGALR